MQASRRATEVASFVLVALLSTGCTATDDTARPALAQLAVQAETDTEAALEGYLFAVSGTHVERCTGTTCPLIWTEEPDDPNDPNDPRPFNCGGGFEPVESYIVHQRGADWDGIEGEAELHGNEYELAERITPFPPPGIAPPGTVRVEHNQSVIIQCCEAEPRRLVRPAAFIDMKACPDPCGTLGTQCPMTTADGTLFQTYGKCKTVTRWLIETDRCDLVVVEAGWRDPHAPHDLFDPSGDDKRVFNLYYRAAWTVATASATSGRTSIQACSVSARPTVRRVIQSAASPFMCRRQNARHPGPTAADFHWRGPIRARRRRREASSAAARSQVRARDERDVQAAAGSRAHRR